MKIALIVVSLLLLFFIVRCFKLANQNVELSQTLLDQSLEMTAEGDVVKENFLKFLSDSREAAFEYIEEVQNGLNKFVNEVDPIMNYWDEYAGVVYTPHDKSISELLESYKELKQLLPKENNN